MGGDRRECQIVRPAPWSPRQSCEAGTGPEWLEKKDAQRFPTVSASRKPTPAKRQAFQVLGWCSKVLPRLKGFLDWLFIKIFHSAVLQFPGLLKAFLLGSVTWRHAVRK